MSDQPIKHTPGPLKFTFMQGETAEFTDPIIISTTAPMGQNGICSLWINRRGEWKEGNGQLLAIADHAPHVCSDPTCPGAVNKQIIDDYMSNLKIAEEWDEARRKLEDYEQLRRRLELWPAVLSGFGKALILFVPRNKIENKIYLNLKALLARAEEVSRE